MCSPSATQEICRACLWYVTGPEGTGEYVLISTCASRGIRTRTASLTTCPPAGTTTEGFPAKVRGRRVPASAAAVSGPAETAIDACVRVSGARPKRLDRVTRARVPPAVVCTTFRTDRPASPAVSVPGSPPPGAVAQAVTQVPAEAGATGLPARRPPGPGCPVRAGRRRTPRRRSRRRRRGRPRPSRPAGPRIVRAALAGRRAGVRGAAPPCPRHGSCCSVLLGKREPRAAPSVAPWWVRAGRPGAGRGRRSSGRTRDRPRAGLRVVDPGGPGCRGRPGVPLGDVPGQSPRTDAGNSCSVPGVGQEGTMREGSPNGWSGWNGLRRRTPRTGTPPGSGPARAPPRTAR